MTSKSHCEAFGKVKNVRDIISLSMIEFLTVKEFVYV